jgi:hypothetical protein
VDECAEMEERKRRRRKRRILLFELKRLYVLLRT